MDQAKYAETILNIILLLAEQTPKNSIQIKVEYLHKNMNDTLYIYSIEENSKLIRILAYTSILNSYTSWITLGGGDSAFLSIISEFIAHLCGQSAELYLNTLLTIMEAPINV